jgi:hypothetical protein
MAATGGRIHHAGWPVEGWEELVEVMGMMR